MAIKHIIFDIDGTLLDTEYAVLHSLQDTVAELTGKTLRIETLKFALGIPGAVALEKLGIRDTKTANQLWNDHLVKYHEQIRLFPGIVHIIKAISDKGFHLGIITSKNREEYHADFVPFGLDDYFENVLCVEDYPKPKPDPAPIAEYLKRTGAAADEVIYIGDTSYDCQCAKSAGVKFGLAEWGCTNASGINPDYIFPHPVDILKLL